MRLHAFITHLLNCVEQLSSYEPGNRRPNHARSCLYASTQLNPHYFEEKKKFSKKNVV